MVDLQIFPSVIALVKDAQLAEKWGRDELNNWLVRLSDAESEFPAIQASALQGHRWEHHDATRLTATGSAIDRLRTLVNRAEDVVTLASKTSGETSEPSLFEGMPPAAVFAEAIAIGSQLIGDHFLKAIEHEHQIAVGNHSEQPPTETVANQQRKGVSYYDAAMFLEGMDEDAAKDRTSYWTRRKWFKGIEILGNDPRNAKRKLAGCAAIIKILSENLTLDDAEKRGLKAYLKTQEREPRK